MAQKKYLDYDGLSHFWLLLKEKLTGKVDKEFKTGSQSQYKVLSDNNLTDELVEKINNAGDSSFTGNYTDLIGKPQINGHELAEGNNTLESLGIQAAGDYATKTEVDGKVDKEDGKGLSTNDYTTEDKNKLAGIAAGAQVNIIESIKVNGSIQSIEEKAVDIKVPTKVSELENDSSFQTNAEVDSKISTATADMATNTSVQEKITEATADMATQTYVNQQVANINKKQVVSSVEEMTDPNTIYLIANEGSGNNIYDEYIVYNGTPEKIGTTEVNLEGYLREEDLVAITNGEIDIILAS